MSEDFRNSLLLFLEKKKWNPQELRENSWNTLMEKTSF